MATESVATPIAAQIAMRKILAGMSMVKVARHALQSKDMNQIEEDVFEALDGVIELLDQAYSRLSDPEAN